MRVRSILGLKWRRRGQHSGHFGRHIERSLLRSAWLESVSTRFKFPDRLGTPAKLDCPSLQERSRDTGVPTDHSGGGGPFQKFTRSAADPDIRLLRELECLPPVSDEFALLLLAEQASLVKSGGFTLVFGAAERCLVGPPGIRPPAGSASRQQLLTVPTPGFSTVGVGSET
jgi:hypothetical protein